MDKKHCTHKDVFNGVCGKCLMSIEGVEHDNKGQIVKDTRAKNKNAKEYKMLLKPSKPSFSKKMIDELVDSESASRKSKTTDSKKPSKAEIENAREAVYNMDKDGFGLDGPDFVPMEEQKCRHALKNKNAKYGPKPNTIKDKRVKKAKIKKAIKAVIKKHDNLFKRLAPRDVTYSLQFEDLVLLFECAALVKEKMGWDYDKVTLWLATENLNFGGTSPISLIRLGKGERVLQFIKLS